jgi:hypothetical protein
MLLLVVMHSIASISTSREVTTTLSSFLSAGEKIQRPIQDASKGIFLHWLTAIPR